VEGLIVSGEPERGGSMTVEQAIATAIEYEKGVRDHYAKAVAKAEHKAATTLFSLMADEEQHHVDYLEHKLREWTNKGRVTVEGLRTALPSPGAIAKGVAGLKDLGTERASGAEIEYLERALAVETETSAFYRRMVGELPGDARTLFARFLESEDGHLAVVQAQIDYLSGTGYWFDVREFDLEG
jgi:rubrerythrin